MAIDITLNEMEMRSAAALGVERSIRAIMRGSVNPVMDSKHDGIWTAAIIGAGGELAVAKYLGVYFDPTVDTYKRQSDLPGDLEVRTRSKEDYDLMIRHNDVLSRIFVLVTGVRNVYRLHGYMRGRDAIRPEWWMSPGGYAPAYFVPKQFLTPIENLKIHIAGVK